jgi:hypothetical protein
MADPLVQDPISATASEQVLEHQELVTSLSMAPLTWTDENGNFVFNPLGGLGLRETREAFHAQKKDLAAYFRCDCVELWEFIVLTVEAPAPWVNILTLSLAGKGTRDAQADQAAALQTLYTGRPAADEDGLAWLNAMHAHHTTMCKGDPCPLPEKLSSADQKAVGTAYRGGINSAPPHNDTLLWGQVYLRRFQVWAGETRGPHVHSRETHLLLLL